MARSAGSISEVGYKNSLGRREQAKDFAFDARQHLRAGIGFQNRFWQQGDHADYNDSLHHYDQALQQAASDPSLLSVIMCHRLSLSIGEYEFGRLSPDNVQQEIDETRQAAKAISRRTDFALRRHNLAWVNHVEAGVNGTLEDTISMEAIALKEAVEIGFVPSLEGLELGLQFY